MIPGIRLARAIVTSRSVRRHRRTIAGVAEHPALGSQSVCGFVPTDHVNRDSPPDLLVIPYRLVVGVFGRRIGGTQATSKRLQAGIEQADKILEIAFRFRLLGGFVREREFLDAVKVHG